MNFCLYREKYEEKKIEYRMDIKLEYVLYRKSV